MNLMGDKVVGVWWDGRRPGDEWKAELRAGDFALYENDEGDVYFYARVEGIVEDEPEYVRCKVYSQLAPDGEPTEVHRGRFTYPLKRHQFVTAWARGWPSHVRRVNTLLNNTGKIALA